MSELCIKNSRQFCTEFIYSIPYYSNLLSLISVLKTSGLCAVFLSGSNSFFFFSSLLQVINALLNEFILMHSIMPLMFVAYGRKHQ